MEDFADCFTSITQQVITKVNETQDAFIFSTIVPFINEHSEIIIEKQELIEAINLINQSNKLEEQTGYSLINQIRSALNPISVQCMIDAYEKGYEKGKADLREKFDKCFDWEPKQSSEEE